MDAVGSNIRVDTYDWEVKRVLPIINEDINEEWISDKTRYACDGLLNQRLDVPYIKKDGKFVQSSWNEANELIANKLKNTSNDKICGFVGDLTNMETSFVFKEFFDRVLDTNHYETRSEDKYVDTSKRENYIFNSSINGIEESDFIFLVGANPRFEATILNARIRKAYLSNNTKIVSLNDVGDLTYPYESLDGKTSTVKQIVENNHKIAELIKNSKNPLVIVGESLLRSNSSDYIVYSLRKYLSDNGKINDDWNAFNILTCDASTVGNLDLDLVNLEKSNFKNFVLDNLKNNKYEFVFLIGQDNIDFEKKNEFVVYIGSHGDKGAGLADVILPGSAYTEQSGHYTNLEGRIQKAYKASYPPNKAKEDWEIINNLAEQMNNRKLFNDKDELESSMFNYLKLKKENKINPKIDSSNFVDEKINMNVKGYYFSNVIARSSKTMIECNNAKVDIKKTGTEG